MKIEQVKCVVEKEPLKAPFGFKGGYLSELWQMVVQMRDSAGNSGVGLGIQSVLWSDAAVFTGNSEDTGNEMMQQTTEFAAQLAQEMQWTTPLELVDTLFPVVYEQAKVITGRDDLRQTFALNAMVPVDNAAWQLYARANSIKNFDTMIPEEFHAALSGRQDKLAAIPLITYGLDDKGLQETVDAGYFFLKVKIGADPDKDGDQQKMLEWDKQRISQIHNLFRNKETSYTDNGNYPYYLDANGRYESKDTLMRLLDHADKIGALERIVLLEEPFPEDMEIDVSDIPACLAADESAHTDKDAQARIDMGYGAVALKPIAKTMSMSLKIAKLAHERNVPCFCADLTVNPVMVDWNKCVAARLKPLPGMKIGVLESNGLQNYSNWDAMTSYHPYGNALWAHAENGLFNLNEEFYELSGGILEDSPHYVEICAK